MTVKQLKNMIRNIKEEAEQLQIQLVPATDPRWISLNRRCKIVLNEMRRLNLIDNGLYNQLKQLG